MERLCIPHVSYTLLWSDGHPYSVCEDFVSPDTELVGAWRVMRTMKKDNSTSVYQHFVKCCQALGVENIVPALNQMIVLDYLIANEDRHLNNFGLLRNPETLEWIGMAPIFDSGSSLGYDRTASRIRIDHDATCKPFKKHHAEQLKLVSSFDWIDFDDLTDVGILILASRFLSIRWSAGLPGGMEFCRKICPIWRRSLVAESRTLGLPIRSKRSRKNLAYSFPCCAEAVNP